MESVHKTHKYKIKWERELGICSDSDSWKQIHLNVIFPMDTQLRWFQYKVIHRILGTNCLLYKMGISDSPLCTFCKDKPETIVHLLWECPVTTQVIDDVREWLSNAFGQAINVNCQEFLLGNVRAKFPALDLIMSLLKFHIFKKKQKCCRPNIVGFLKDVKMYYQLECYIYKVNCNNALLQARWSGLHHLLHLIGSS